MHACTYTHTWVDSWHPHTHHLSSRARDCQMGILMNGSLPFHFEPLESMFTLTNLLHFDVALAGFQYKTLFWFFLGKRSGNIYHWKVYAITEKASPCPLKITELPSTHEKNFLDPIYRSAEEWFSMSDLLVIATSIFHHLQIILRLEHFHFKNHLLFCMIFYFEGINCP